MLDMLVTPFCLQLLMSVRRDQPFNVIDKILSLESFWVPQTKVGRWQRVLRGWLRYLFKDEPRPRGLFLFILVNCKIIGAWSWDILHGKKSVILIIDVVEGMSEHCVSAGSPCCPWFLSKELLPQLLFSLVCKIIAWPRFLRFKSIFNYQLLHLLFI